MVLCARRSTRCGVVFLLSHDLSQVGSRSWQTLCRRSWTVCSMWHGSACSIASWSRSWMCQCHRSWRKSWSLLLVRSSTTLVQASGDSTGGRARNPQEQNVEVIKVILQEQCQRMRFFLLTACGKGAVGGTFHTCCPTVNSHTPGLILSASDGMFVMYHIREQTTIMTALCLCVARKMSSASPARACISASIASLSFVLARFSPVPSLALRTGSNDQCDGNQCCHSFGGCPRGHPGVEPAAQCVSTRGNSPGFDTQ